jgi:hypothetical protein
VLQPSHTGGWNCSAPSGPTFLADDRGLAAGGVGGGVDGWWCESTGGAGLRRVSLHNRYRPPTAAAATVAVRKVLLIELGVLRQWSTIVECSLYNTTLNWLNQHPAHRMNTVSGVLACAYAKVYMWGGKERGRAAVDGGELLIRAA